MNFDLTAPQRAELFQHVLTRLEDYYANTKRRTVTPPLDIQQIRDFVDQLDFGAKTTEDRKTAIDHVLTGLEQYAVHTPHPKYFGLYNPRANFAGILADLMTATYNPQLAAWSHSPFASEVERELIQAFGLKFGYQEDTIDGVFAAGGAEANLTALLCALQHTFPAFAKEGLVGMSKRPIIYCSAEAHHSVHKAAKTVGLGYASVRNIAVDAELKMEGNILADTIEQDLAAGHQPFMLIGTAGTTGTGTIDPLPALATIAQQYQLWFHVDAAYGGGAILQNDLRAHLSGVEHSDSITFDAHKWMSVPMGTSLFITSHKNILSKTFGMATEYMPKEASELAVVDPYTHSIQWSRRFIGLKLYLSLLFFGWEGYAQVVGHQTKMGDLFREKLVQHGWSIKNQTPFPVICFTDDRFAADEHFTQTILRKIIASGKSWLSIYPVHGMPTFRVCITNYATTEVDLEELVAELNVERALF